MSNMAMEAARLMDMLPESDQNFAYEFIKRKASSLTQEILTGQRSVGNHPRQKPLSGAFLLIEYKTSQ